MESAHEPAEQLAELERLQETTRNESLRGRPWAMPVLAVALVLFFASYLLSTNVQEAVAPVVWTAFVVGWVLWLRHGNRARPRWPAGYDWRRDLPLWLGLLVLANLIVIVGSRVSWLLVGILMALLSTGAGIAARLRSSR